MASSKTSIEVQVKKIPVTTFLPEDDVHHRLTVFAAERRLTLANAIAVLLDETLPKLKARKSVA